MASATTSTTSNVDVLVRIEAILAAILIELEKGKKP